MFEKLKYHKEDSLIRDGIILFSATMVGNILGYLYHFVMGRVLGPSDYGVLGAILSLLYLINVPVNVIQTTLTKFTAQYKAAQQEKKVNTMLRAALRKMIILGIIGIIIFLLVTPLLSKFLKIPLLPLLAFSPIILFALLMPVTGGILQGMQKFKSLGLNLIVEGLAKFSIGVGLVFLGFKVNGAITGITLSFLIAFLFAYKPLKKYLQKTQEQFSSKEIYKYSIPVFLALLFLTGFYTIDMLLVKHFFSEYDAGLYAALALIGKMIFFGTFAIGNVMFPKVAEMHSLNKDNKNLLNKSLILMAIGSALAVLIYFLFPELIVKILFGQEYLTIAPLVVWIGIVMSFFSLSYLLSLYNLSINKTSFIYILAIFLIAEAILITTYHQNLEQVIKILAATMAILFLTLLAYTRSK